MPLRDRYRQARWIVGAALLAFAPSQSYAQTGKSAILYATLAQSNEIHAYRIDCQGRIQNLVDRFQYSSETNPRRLIPSAAGDVLYVAGRRRVDAFGIDDSGKLTVKTPRPAFIEEDGQGANFQYIALDPLERYLYASAKNLDRILGYPIDPTDGSLLEWDSCVQGGNASLYQGIVATETALYVSSHFSSSASFNGRIEIFPLKPTTDADGRAGAILAAEADTPTADPDDKDDATLPPGNSRLYEGVDTNDDGNVDAYERVACDEGGADLAQLKVFPDCTERAFAWRRSGGIVNPRALFLRDRPADPNRLLYIIDFGIENRVLSCKIDEEDCLPGCKTQPKTKCKKAKEDRPEEPAENCTTADRTRSGGRFEQLELSVDDVLYASIFVSGGMRAFGLKDDGLVKKKPLKVKPNDVLSAPLQVRSFHLCRGEGTPCSTHEECQEECMGVLYVPQGDLDRIDAFRINSIEPASGSEKKKFKPGFQRPTDPFSTVAVDDDDSNRAVAFPNAVAVVPVQSPTCP